VTGFGNVDVEIIHEIVFVVAARLPGCVGLVVWLCDGANGVGAPCKR
jgi:hypothetical protein